MSPWKQLPSLPLGIRLAPNLPGTTDWSNNLTGLPGALWLPQVQTTDVSFGVRSNPFRFSINWASGMTVVIEATNNLANPIWFPVATNTLTSGSAHFQRPTVDELSRPFLPPALAVRRG